MQSKAIEIMVGLFFILGVTAVFILTYRVASLSAGSASNTFVLTASFENIGGLRQGASVTLAGVRIGRVRSIVIDRDSYEALVSMDIALEYDNLPKDSSTSILTAGLLGEQYIGFTPGGDPENLKAGDKVKFTQSAIVLENLIGQLLVSKATETPSQ